ncbi:MAG TPA: DUF302 domain-containing protein [Thermoanaerobaculia bacterium]|nr:DUF302 domain-containing protein [Thermoanaerobaculia bacterium]
MPTMQETAVAFEAKTDRPFEETVERCRQELAKEGFGVLTEIDVKATLKKKLDVDRDAYLILGACHPPSAHRALTASPEVGVLLPCNVCVSVEGGKTVVRAMNPESAMTLLKNATVQDVATEVGAALRRVVQAVVA